MGQQLIFLLAQGVDIPPKDLVLVVDTSKSMVGFGNGYQARNIFDIVKDQLSQSIDRAKIGDTVTLVNYDTETTVFPTVEINSEQDKQALKSQLASLRADGNWTYTAAMIRNLADFLGDLAAKSESEGRNQLAMIFSDAFGRSATRTN